ncbi:Nucleotide-sugar uncharacterized transporter 2 [Cardamine amara subsp. amara]|uniref:Nucleotide-sugar uncharacterized transporter 2 n=1 Tax=Cardamine amara subsp. amara TaxID=228776 RepID=A0ABD1AC79_CARAN
MARTPSIVIAEFVFFKKTIFSTKVMELALVSLGVAIATVTDLESNLFSAVVAVACITSNAINNIIWSNLQ